MKRGLCALLMALMLVLPTTARAETAAPAASAAPAATGQPSGDADEAVYAIYDEQGRYLTSVYGRVYVDDEYITADNALYRIVEVDDAERTAVARYIGQEDMTGLLDDAVATVAQDAKRLIGMYVTHSDESYIPSDGTESLEEDAGIYDVAAELKAQLEQRGIEVQLDETTHLPHDAGAYRRSRATAMRLMKQMPAALLDIHRDGIPDPDEYVQEIEGEDASKVRLLVGRSNPNGEANRRFAKQIKAAADEMYPELIKDIFIGKGDYNQELMPRAILLEFGTHTISKERALKSTGYMADVLDRVLFGTAKAEGAAAGGTDADAGSAAEGQSAQAAGSSGAVWGILLVAIAVVASLIIFGIATTGSVSGMWEKIKRGASETTGGLLGKKRDRDRK